MNLFLKVILLRGLFYSNFLFDHNVPDSGLWIKISRVGHPE